MKTTGIVRRIDELGRVVIPKELRRTMRIREGEEMEIFVAPDDTLVLQKYSAVKAMAEFADEYAHILHSHTGNTVIVCDHDNFITCAGGDEKQYRTARISKGLELFLSKRKSALLRSNELFSLTNEAPDFKEMAICPITVNGDVIGGVIMLNRQAGSMGDTGLKLTEVAADFLAKQIGC